MASIDKRSNGKWRPRYRTHAGGPQRARHFDRKIGAEQFLTRVLRRSITVNRQLVLAGSGPPTSGAHRRRENEELTRDAVDDILGGHQSSARQSS